MGRLKIISSDKPNGIRAVGIVIHKGQLLLIKREHDGREYYTFPGGGVEEGETIVDAVKREIAEESSLQVSVNRLLYHHDLEGDSDHYFYDCAYVSGTPQLGGEELEETRRGNVHHPIWYPVHDLNSIVLYPLEARDWLIEDLQGGFPSVPRVLRLHPSQLRQ